MKCWNHFNQFAHKCFIYHSSLYEFDAHPSFHSMTFGQDKKIQCDINENYLIFHDRSTFVEENNLEETQHQLSQIGGPNSKHKQTKNVGPNARKKCSTSICAQNTVDNTRSKPIKKSFTQNTEDKKYKDCKTVCCDCAGHDGGLDVKFSKFKGSSIELMSLKLEPKCCLKTTQTLQQAQVNVFISTDACEIISPANNEQQGEVQQSYISKLCFRLYFGPSIDETVIHALTSLSLFQDSLRRVKAFLLRWHLRLQTLFVDRESLNTVTHVISLQTNFEKPVNFNKECQTSKTSLRCYVCGESRQTNY